MAADAASNPGVARPPGRDGETRTRTGDTTIFSRVLYQLSYLAARAMLAIARPAGAQRADQIRVNGGLRLAFAGISPQNP